MVALAAAGLSVVFAACGGADGSVFGGNTGGEAATTGAGAGSGSSGTGFGAGPDSSGSGFGSGSGYGDTGAGGASSGTSGAGDGAGGGTSCAGETSTAELVPLDLYIMLDASGSMEDRLPTRNTKWEAITAALEAFFTDPQSAGLGVGLQYFPLRDPNIPETCTSNEECGAQGPCRLGICSSFSRSLRFCATNADCPRNDTCLPLGTCSRSNSMCTNIGGRCRDRNDVCEAITESECDNPNSCDAQVYATPAVDISPLDAAKAEELLASIAAKVPNGGTPTAGALAGAIERARAHAMANPTHRVVAVLATDGMPTGCDPVDAEGIAEIASGGLNGSPSITTFVIGVFDRDDRGAEDTMNRIAEGGGTKAFFIDTNTDVSSAFLAALNEIRGQSLACEYQVPTPSNGQTLDYGTLNVQHTPSGSDAPTTIYYVADEARCDATTGGWYYDVDPATGGTPTKIVMCPATCTQFKDGGQVELKIGCKTEIPPIR